MSLGVGTHPPPEFQLPGDRYPPLDKKGPGTRETNPSPEENDIKPEIPTHPPTPPQGKDMVQGYTHR